MVPSWKPHNGNYNYQCCRDASTGKCDDAGSRTLPWYDKDGNPRVDLHRFPNIKGMVARAHGMGLRAGWYMGNYQCAGANDASDLPKLAAGSVRAIKDFGFDSVKLGA